MARHRVLVVGSGGREHALAWRLARDPEDTEVLVAPGNDGMGLSFRRLEATELDAAALIAACRAEQIELVVIGPEAPLAIGVADALAEAGFPVLGPSREAARLESSKWFAKQLMTTAGIPTARAEAFEDSGAARAALDRFGPPYVVKVDGLAAGKGVRVVHEREAAEAFLADCFEADRFGASGRRVLLEEFLEGDEASVMAICDGRRYVLLPAARDYKRAYDRDLGANTGGMGAYAPHEAVDAAFEDEVGRRVVAPALAAMERHGTPFRGTLYCGLMRHGSSIRVVEFNCRFGDPETQVVMPLLEGSLRELLSGAARGSVEPRAVSRALGARVPRRQRPRGRCLEGAGGTRGHDRVPRGNPRERARTGVRGDRRAAGCGLALPSRRRPVAWSGLRGGRCAHGA